MRSVKDIGIAMELGNPGGSNLVSLSAMIGSTTASTIHPLRAPVRPRVISPETGDAIPLEDVLLESQGKTARAIEIVGGLGSGKTTALAHLAAVLPPDYKVILLDEVWPATVIQAADEAVVVFTSLRPYSIAEVLSYRLAPWSNDELVEYLLAVHPGQCASVMVRLGAAPDRGLPKGLPEIWRLALDRMAGDDSLRSVSEALRQELQQGLPATHVRAGAEQYCLALLTKRFKEAAKCYRGLQRSHVDSRMMSLLRHDAFRLMLASDRLTGLLETESGFHGLEQPLPRELVKATAAVASRTALENLSRWIAEGPAACQAMVASLLHAAGTGWRPDYQPLPFLSDAYLEGARWKGVSLRGARMDRADLSHCDLSEAALDGVLARQASFRESLLHRASLVNFDGTGADFEMAALTSADARFAVLPGAVLTGADLCDACLANADLRGTNMRDARLARADLTGATLTIASIEGADFFSADLRRSHLNGLVLRNTRFTGARFAYAHLVGCDLEGMDLPEADFSRAHLESSLLTGSRMPRARLDGAFLQGARLADIDWEGADLRMADMRNCTFHLGSSRSGLVGSPIACEGSRTGFYGDEFDQQTYRAPEEIRKANLCGTDLRDAYLEGTDFYLVDLRGAKYTRGQFEYLRRCGAILFDRT